ncbi:MAG: hypothetical protein MJ250_08475 [Alphaproteobacteria bacterium]|nr:hypothetical protein [Alphaproteobacteria bacterium]
MKLNERQAFDFITEKPKNFTDDLKQLETYVFSVYSADLWDYEPQAQTEEFITYLVYTYKDKWNNIYKNELQNLGTKFSISQNNNKETNSDYILTADGVKATLNGTDKDTSKTITSTKSLDINDLKSFFTIVIDDIKKEILIYKGE